MTKKKPAAQNQPEPPRTSGDNPRNNEHDSPYIFSYTRAQAIEDGVLVDVTETAREAGITFPTALTNAVFEKYVRVPDGVDGQDTSGRLWDVLWMLRYGITQAKDHGSEIFFELRVRNDNRAAKKVTLKAVCGPGDNAEPVITVMLRDED